MARRHLAGGMIVFDGPSHPLAPELWGRSGGIMHVGSGRCWKKDRPEQEVARDMVIIGLNSGADDALLAAMKKAKEGGKYVIGFGSQAAAPEHVQLCDAFFENGVPAGGEQEDLRANVLVDTLNGWCLTAEHVAALTRHGKMPVMAKSFIYEDGRQWWEDRFGKAQFHDDLQIAPIPEGKLARDYITHMRGLLVKFREAELADVRRAAALISAELRRVEKINVSFVSHMTSGYVARGRDAAWATPHYMWDDGEPAIKKFRETVPDGALTVRLGYAGLHRSLADLFVEKKQRMILIYGENVREDWLFSDELQAITVVDIDMGYAMGDSAIAVEGYPFRLFPPSGVMQIVAYESINAEVLAAEGEGQ